MKTKRRINKAQQRENIGLLIITAEIFIMLGWMVNFIGY